MKLNDRPVFALSIVVTLSLFFCASAIFHVTAQQSACPTVSVSCPDTINTGEKPTFIVNVSGGDPNVTPTYNWTVSNGTISSGQGTSVIELDTSGLAGDSSITATVEVGGYDRACSVVNSCTTSVMKKAEARKMDEYGKIAVKAENSRLDNFAIELVNDPTAQGYIITYGGRVSAAGAAKKMADRAKNYLVKKRRLDAKRVMAINGGLREEPAVELWIVPAGAEPPTATPTVDPSEAKPKKAAPKKAAPKKAKPKKAPARKS